LSRWANSMSSHEIIGRFLFEALDLVATYLFSQSVALEATPVGALVGKTQRDDETTRFLQYLEARHALACAMRLRPIVSGIESGLSSRGKLARVVSKGAIRGRLDVPRYLAGRTQRTLPRTYPLIANEATPDTPENTLVVQSLRGLARQLGMNRFPRSTAEGQASLGLYDWTRRRLRRWPWAEVTTQDPIDRLRRQTLLRTRKRQTGNELAYGSLLEWLAEWQVDVSRLGSQDLNRVVDGLLAFPIDDFFRNKVFEVWCLREIAQSLVRCGCVPLDEPRPLHQRHVGPVYQLQRGSSRFGIWFQSQRPLGTPRWHYDDTGRPLSGIPDIIVSTDGRAPLVADAKLRGARPQGRSEETYKMLGYHENFRDSAARAGFRGLLVFAGSGNSGRTLAGPYGGRLSLLVVDHALELKRDIQELFDSVIREWLDVSDRGIG